MARVMSRGNSASDWKKVPSVWTGGKAFFYFRVVNGGSSNRMRQWVSWDRLNSCWRASWEVRRTSGEKTGFKTIRSAQKYLDGLVT